MKQEIIRRLNGMKDDPKRVRSFVQSIQIFLNGEHLTFEVGQYIRNDASIVFINKTLERDIKIRIYASDYSCRIFSAKIIDVPSETPILVECFKSEQHFLNTAFKELIDPFSTSVIFQKEIKLWLTRNNNGEIVYIENSILNETKELNVYFNRNVGHFALVADFPVIGEGFIGSTYKSKEEANENLKEFLENVETMYEESQKPRLKIVTLPYHFEE